VDPNSGISTGIKRSYTHRAVDFAASNGDIKVLQWWVNESSCELQYTTKALEGAISNGHPEVLKWWSNTLSFDCTRKAVTYASANNRLSVLRTWLALDEEHKWDASAMDQASLNGHVRILQWWKESGLKLRYSPDLIEQLLASGTTADLEVVQWWKKSNI